MKDICRLRTSLIVLAIMTLCACSPSPSSSAPTDSKPKEGKPSSEKEYSFTIQGGKKIAASVFDASQKYGEGKKLIIYAPFVDKTDGNFYLAALEAFWSIYGKKRGLFQLGDAQTEYVSSMEGNAIFWYISNPRQRFYSLPIKDSGTGSIGAMVVWVSDLTASDKLIARQRSTPAKIETAEQPDQEEKAQSNIPDETARTEDANVVKTSKGTPKMTELEDNKAKRYRYP